MFEGAFTTPSPGSASSKHAWDLEDSGEDTCGKKKKYVHIFIFYCSIISITTHYHAGRSQRTSP